jgi:long-chain acyl-CoA synthetase
LVEGYGLTEAGPVCTINPISGVNKAGSTGLPVPGTVIEIASLDDPDKILPLGGRGEICVSGPQVMAGYWKNEDETAEVLQGGRLHTGDVGYIDEDGYVYLVDRIKDLIITGGFNVYPRMVEEAILLHPAVDEAAVCGVPSQHRGEIVKAYITLRDGADLTASELRAFLKDKLAPFEQPRQIEFRSHIPKTLVGKPLRRELIADELRKQERANAATADERAEGGPA